MASDERQLIFQYYLRLIITDYKCRPVPIRRRHTHREMNPNATGTGMIDSNENWAYLSGIKKLTPTFSQNYFGIYFKILLELRFLSCIEAFIPCILFVPSFYICLRMMREIHCEKENRKHATLREKIVGQNGLSRHIVSSKYRHTVPT